MVLLFINWQRHLSVHNLGTCSNCSLAEDPTIPEQKYVTSEETAQRYVMTTFLKTSSFHFLQLMILSLVFEVVARARGIDKEEKQIITAIMGIYVLMFYCGMTTGYILSVAAGMYIFIHCETITPHRMLFIGFINILASEIYMPKEQWIIARLPVMLMTINAVSLVYESRQLQILLESLGQEDPPEFYIPYYDYVGYMFCIGTPIFGPQMPFFEYLSFFLIDELENMENNNYNTVIHNCCKSIMMWIYTVFFYTLAICSTEWLFPSTPNTFIFKVIFYIQPTAWYMNNLWKARMYMMGQPRSYFAQDVINYPFLIKVAKIIVELYAIYNGIYIFEKNFPSFINTTELSNSQ